MFSTVIKILAGLVVLLAAITVTADMATTFQDASTFATNQKAANPAANTANTANVPNYTATPPQASYYSNSGAMATDGNAVAQTNQAGQFMSASQNRPLFVIDPVTDPVLVRSMLVTSPTNLQNFLKQFGGCYTEQQVVPGAVTQQTCQEYRPDQIFTCNKTLNVTSNSITRLEYYPSKCVSFSVFCDSQNAAGNIATCSSANSLGYTWMFVNGGPYGQVAVTYCDYSCNFAQVNGWTFGRGTNLAWCDLNNCGTMSVSYSSEGIPTYTCNGAVGSTMSIPASCPAGYDMTTMPDGKVVCRESSVSLYASNPACSKISEIPQLSTGGVTAIWEIWACDSWQNDCATFESRAP